MLPGYANGDAVPIGMRIVEDRNACTMPHGPVNPTLMTLIRWCTGAALTGPIGMIMNMPSTTFKAENTPVKVNFLVIWHLHFIKGLYINLMYSPSSTVHSV